MAYALSEGRAHILPWYRLVGYCVGIFSMRVHKHNTQKREASGTWWYGGDSPHLARNTVCVSGEKAMLTKPVNIWGTGLQLTQDKTVGSWVW